MKSFDAIIDSLPPDKAMTALSQAVKKLFAYADEAARLDFLHELLGDADDNSLSGLVHR